VDRVTKAPATPASIDQGSGATWSAILAPIALLGNQLPVPCQEAAWGDDGHYLPKDSTTKHLGLGCQTLALIVIQTEGFLPQLLSKYSVLLAQVVASRCCWPSHPATEISRNRKGSMVRSIGPE